VPRIADTRERSARNSLRIHGEIRDVHGGWERWSATHPSAPRHRRLGHDGHGYRMRPPMLVFESRQRLIVEDAFHFVRKLVVQEFGIVLLAKRGVRLLTASGNDLTDSDDWLEVRHPSILKTEHAPVISSQLALYPSLQAQQCAQRSPAVASSFHDPDPNDDRMSPLAHDLDARLSASDRSFRAPVMPRRS
jgi:hypothetical protein